VAIFCGNGCALCLSYFLPKLAASSTLVNSPTEHLNDNTIGVCFNLAAFTLKSIRYCWALTNQVC
jgi:hypothetical protein